MTVEDNPDGIHEESLVDRFVTSSDLEHTSNTRACLCKMPQAQNRDPFRRKQIFVTASNGNLKRTSDWKLIEQSQQAPV